VLEACIIGQHVISVRTVAEETDNGGILAFDDLHHASFSTAIGTPPDDARQHAVAVHRVFQRIATNEEVALDAFHGAVGNEESIAIAMGGNPSGDQIGIARTLWLSGLFIRGWFSRFRLSGLRALQARGGSFAAPAICFREEISSAVDLSYLATLFKLRDDTRKIAACMVLQAQTVGELADTNRLRYRGQMGEHLLARHVFGARFFFGSHGEAAFQGRIVSSGNFLCISATVAQRPDNSVTEIAAGGKDCVRCAQEKNGSLSISAPIGLLIGGRD
jgi:hypothetical protein